MKLEEHNKIISGWEGYELLDSGNGRKLERFGDIVLDRPDPQALWQKTNESLWKNAHAQFTWAEKGERWKLLKEIPEEWQISWKDIRATLSLKGFKHVGIFPEHHEQWELFRKIGKENPGIKMLNLFGYTGIASVVAAKAGIEVTHVDASKQTLSTLKENMKASGLREDAIRILCEDALRYAKRLVERGEQFEIIVMDPPAFGRGPKGEVWKIEESLGELVVLLPKLVSKNAKLVVLNGYASGFAARTFGELLRDVFPEGEIIYGEIALEQKNADRMLTTGIYASWKSR